MALSKIIGTQLLVLMISLLLLSLIGTFYPGNRGALTSAVIFCYCLTAGISGHVSGGLYVQMGGQKWATNAVLTACIFPVPFFVIFLVVNSIAWIYNSTMALPFLYIFAVIVLWSVVTFPLTIYAAHRVRNISPQLDVPIKPTTKVAREIPDLPWYRSAWLQIILTGILPFTAIYIELHFLFTAIFGHQVYTLFGILSLAFFMLLIVTAAVTIAVTYFQLQSEDWRWWWRSFATAGSPGIYILGYAVFYYYYRSYMNGVLQAAFFFGYVTAVSYAFFLMLGAVGWWSTFTFLKQIYGAIKPE
ncbi:EMP/nonaspanin domain family protein [Reticulomyxa filosa]|uniref:Transmembrane 9 superfamily member n=1 Tax=Reticulomyxa filosa TaxID=46433 RepID=X6NW05_RETFI|nr:EMP/nonaspanin domain family protein [Reticulomyxa filosa]|eukprot:ETO29447.1 EMP/nonaspanin domain family protein [Reticulomyxa filosa]